MASFEWTCILYDSDPQELPNGYIEIITDHSIAQRLLSSSETSPLILRRKIFELSDLKQTIKSLVLLSIMLEDFVMSTLIDQTVYLQLSRRQQVAL